MPFQAMYGKVAGQYTTANQFGSISKSHECAIEQIRKVKLGQETPYKVLDFGVGNGSFLQKLRHLMPDASFTGIDVSREKLKCAQKTLGLTTIETSATEASYYIPHASQNLVLAHFINAYIPIGTLFDEAKLLTKEDGHFSLITTTYDSFPAAQRQLAEFIASGCLLSSIVGHYYKAIVKNTTVAASEDVLLKTFANHQFEVVEHQRLHIPISLNSIDELALFGIEGTWFLNNLSIRMLPRHFLLQRLRRLFRKIFTFPYQDTHIIDIVLAKKV